MIEASLRLSNITKTYPGVCALDGVSFECRPGEIHAVLGENGSGKSTLLGIASGATAADAGTIEIMGRRLEAADPLQARALGLATVYQDDSLIRELTVAENLYLAATDPNLSYGGVRAWAAEKLAPYNLDIAPGALVGALTPAQRQFLEIVKALISCPKVLLLDEPTSTLDLDGVAKLAAIVRRLAAEGVAIVYVTHRLPEILDLAARVTILRDGVGRGTFAIDDSVRENELIALMVGRAIEAEYPPKAGCRMESPALSVTGLEGEAFRGISFVAHRGEILGLGGAEGNGQRETLRALGGLVAFEGALALYGRPLDLATPGRVAASGIAFLSADRSEESIFADLTVRENITVRSLVALAPQGLVSARREYALVGDLIAEYRVVSTGPDQAIGGLSGGNQQKAVLARSFLGKAEVVLIDEPTQGVDAGARFEIYRAIREKIARGTTCIVNSSDALELAGLCDRVLVFSRGRIVSELSGDTVTEANIVTAFLSSRGEHTASAQERATIAPLRRLLAAWSDGAASWWAPPALLLALILVVGVYAATGSDVFLTSLNLRHILLATAPLAFAAMAQLNALLVRGFDISIGAIMTLVVVIASYLVTAPAGLVLLIIGLAACIAAGLVVGAINGALIRFTGVNPVIATIAMLSILQGIALLVRPTPGGIINPDFTGLLRTRLGFLPLSAVVILLLAVLGDLWLLRSKPGLQLQATGFREKAAIRNGVRATRLHLRAYLLSALLAAIAGLFLASEVGVGHPSIGSTYALTSIAAAVIGGASLSGGRGSYLGAFMGALFFSLVVNVISLLGLNTAVGIIVTGALTLFAVFLYSGLKPARRLLRRLFAPRPQPHILPAE